MMTPTNTEIRQEFYPESNFQSADDYSCYLLRLSTIWGEEFLDTAGTQPGQSQYLIEAEIDSLW